MDLGHFDWDIVWRLLCAAGLGGIVGLDRQLAGKAAGLRTHMMVGLGAAAFTLGAVSLTQAALEPDVTRIITGVATGIGFLGAGSIMKSGRKVEGITTAAGIWVVGAVGVACGLGAYGLAFSTTMLAALILVIVGRLETKTRKSSTKIPLADQAGDVTEKGLSRSTE